VNAFLATLDTAEREKAVDAVLQVALSSGRPGHGITALTCVARGLTDAESFQELFISLSATKTHISSPAGEDGCPRPRPVDHFRVRDRDRDPRQALDLQSSPQCSSVRL
jgi:hypothetical protein